MDKLRVVSPMPSFQRERIICAHEPFYSFDGGLLILSACGDKRVAPRGLERDETLWQVQVSGHAESRPGLEQAEVAVQVDFALVPK